MLGIGLAAGIAIAWWRGAARPAVQPLVRLTVDLEPEMTPAGTGTVLALSPDGMRLALAVRCEDGKIRLATRRLEQAHLHAVTGDRRREFAFLFSGWPMDCVLRR